MRIGIDAMGGDGAPTAEVQGALDACALLSEDDIATTIAVERATQVLQLAIDARHDGTLRKAIGDLPRHVDRRCPGRHPTSDGAGTADRNEQRSGQDRSDVGGFERQPSDEPHLLCVSPLELEPGGKCR